MKLLTRLFSKSHPAADATFTAAQATWLHQALGSIFRRQLPPQKFEDGLVTPDLLAVLRAHSIEYREITVRAWLDEATTHQGQKLLALTKEGPALIMGHNAGKALVVSPQQTKPQLVEVSTFLSDPTIQVFAFDAPKTEEVCEKFGWRWVLSAFFSRKKVIRDVLIASLVIQVIGLAYPLATQAIVDKVIANQAQSTLIALGVGVAAFALFNALMSWLRQKLLLRLSMVVDGELSRKVIAHLVKLPLKYFESSSTGLLIARTKGVARAREFASQAFLLVALDIPFMVIFLAIMISYSGVLSGVVACFVVVMVGLSFACGPFLRNYANKQFETSAKVQSYLTERVAAYETIKSLQLEDDSVNRFAEYNQAELQASLELQEFSSGYQTVMQLLEQLLATAVLCAGAYLAMTQAGLTIGMLVAFQMFSQRVTQPLLRMAGLWQELQQVRTAIMKLGDVMSSPAESYLRERTSTSKPKGSIELVDLGFRYSPDTPYLYKGLNLTVKPGEVALITGPSGCGKSTLAKILQGYFGGFEGSVKIDGRDIRTLPVNELRSFFGVVPQETVLFAGTILSNLQLGNNCSFEQIVQACKMADIHDAIERMPKGYQAVIGEHGVGLSGGQRQRLGIARALLKQPAVLIFDEATSGLDEASAEYIGKTINSLKGRVSVIFITHRVPESLEASSRLSLTTTMKFYT